MIWIGLDVHKGFSRMGVFDPATGELADVGQVSTEREELAARLREIGEEKTVVLEAGRNCHHVAAMLEPMAERVWIVDPVAVRKLQQRIAKTDRRDATALAFWAAKGALEPLWRPDARTLDLRELTRGKTTLVRLAARVRNLIRSLLARHGYECPYRDLLGVTCQQWLQRVVIAGHGGKMLAVLLELLPTLQGKAEEFEELVAEEAGRHPHAQRLMTIPGVGPFLGLAMAVEIGDPKRFRTAGGLRGYSGLVPSVHQSSDRLAHGRLTKKGNRWLRYVAVLAAQRMAMLRKPDAKLKRSFLSVAFRHGRNPAKVATARRLLDLAWHLMVNEEDYRAPTPRVLTV
jgi:transposase